MRARTAAFDRHRFAPLVEPLTESATFLSRPMFGCVGCYVNGRLVLVLADRGAPWQGILVPLERVQHAEVLRSFPELHVHPVLPKWLYLPESQRGFEGIARRIVSRIRDDDPKFGVEPRPRRFPTPSGGRGRFRGGGVSA